MSSLIKRLTMQMVLSLRSDTPAELLHTYAPIFLLRAAIIKKEDIVGRESVDEAEVLSFKEGYSTSDIVKKIAMMAKEGTVIIVVVPVLLVVIL